MYFQKASGSSDSLGYLADGITEALIHELSEVPQLHVVSKSGVNPYRNASVAPDSIGRALKVGTLVQGSVAGSGDRLRVSVSLINASNAEEIGSKTLERPRTEIFALQDDVAREVSLFLRERLGQEIKVQEVRVGTRNPQAWEQLQQAGKLSKDADPLLAAGDTAGAARRLNQASRGSTRAGSPLRSNEAGWRIARPIWSTVSISHSTPSGRRSASSTPTGRCKSSLEIPMLSSCEAFSGTGGGS
jgi:TolB-like protein